MTTTSLALSLLVVGACTTASVVPLSEPHAPRLTLRAAELEAAPWFPMRRSAARLPSADALRSVLRAIGRDELTARLRLCVTPAGASTVELRESSGVESFDEAVVHDMTGWSYKAFSAPAAVRVCEPVTLTYLP